MSRLILVLIAKVCISGSDEPAHMTRIRKEYDQTLPMLGETPKLHAVQRRLMQPLNNLKRRTFQKYREPTRFENSSQLLNNLFTRIHRLVRALTITWADQENFAGGGGGRGS